MNLSDADPEALGELAAAGYPVATLEQALESARAYLGDPSAASSFLFGTTDLVKTEA